MQQDHYNFDVELNKIQPAQHSARPAYQEKLYNVGKQRLILLSGKHHVQIVMARNNSATITAVPPWSHVSMRAAGTGAAWIPWTRAWVWVLLWALLTSKVEPSMHDAQRPGGVVTSVSVVVNRAVRPVHPAFGLGAQDVVVFGQCSTSKTAPSNYYCIVATSPAVYAAPPLWVLGVQHL